MIETKDIQKMVNHIVRRDKGVSDPQIMHPTREWFTGLGIAVLVVGLGSWFCIYTYFSFEEKLSQQIIVQEPAIPYRSAVVEEAVSLFASKKEVYDKILQRYQGSATVQATTTAPVPAIEEGAPEIDSVQDIESTPASVSGVPQSF